MRSPSPLGILTVAMLSLHLASACPAQDQPEAKKILRVLDVRDIVRAEPRFLPATALEASFSPSAPEATDNPIAAFELADLVTLVMTASGPEYWGQEGVEIHPEDNGLLSVRCSKAQHAAVNKTLSQIRNMIFEPVAIEVHELPDSALDSRRTVLSSQEADALIAAAGSHPIHSGRTTLHKRLLIESKQLQNRVEGLRSRVAQSAATVDPIISTDAYGASWEVRASRTVGDSLLVTVSGSTRALEPKATTREVRSGEKGHTAEIDLLTTRITTYLSTARLGPGQAMLVGSRAPAGKVLCIRIRRLGPPASTTLGAVTAFPIRSLVGSAPRGPNPQVRFDGSTLFPEVDEEPMPTVLDDGRLQELIATEVNPDTWDGAPNTMSVENGYLLVTADEQTLAGVQKQLETLDAIDARQFTLEVRFGEVTATDTNLQDPANVAKLAESLSQTCLSTLSASRDTQLSATRHSQVVHDYDVIIASGSATTSPEVTTITEGFLLHGAVTPMHDQSVLLDLNMTILERDSKRTVFDLKHPAIGPIDNVRVRQNKVRGACPVELGTWTILHLAPLPGSKKHLAVAARVHAL